MRKVVRRMTALIVCFGLIAGFFGAEARAAEGAIGPKAHSQAAPLPEVLAPLVPVPSLGLPSVSEVQPFPVAAPLAAAARVPEKLNVSQPKPAPEASSSRPVVLVTGSGAGIGLAIAQRLIAENYRVAMTAREPTLNSLRSRGFFDGDNLMLLPLDVTSPSQRQSAIARVEQHWGRLDVLINNAAAVVFGAGEHLRPGDLRRSMETNFIGPAMLAREAIPLMRKQGGGRILNISSTAAEIPSLLMGAYGASKAALNNFMATLGREVAPFGIHVSVLELGFIDSDAHEKIGVSELAEKSRSDPEDLYHRTYHRVLRAMSMGRRLSRSTPESVARQVSRLIKSSAHTHVRGTPDSLTFHVLKRILPTAVFVRVVDSLLSLTSDLEVRIAEAKRSLVDDSKDRAR